MVPSQEWVWFSSGEEAIVMRSTPSDVPKRTLSQRSSSSAKSIQTNLLAADKYSVASLFRNPEEKVAFVYQIANGRDIR
jgi:hypothetical protein